MENDISSYWKEATAILEQSSLNPAAYTSWIKPLIPYKIEFDNFILLAKNEHIQTTVRARYIEKITTAIKLVVGEELNVKIVLESDINQSNAKKEIAKTEPYYLSNLRSKYVFENFVKGKSNEFAYAAAMAVAEEPGTRYNPLFLHGDVGLGKTHLMHSVGNYILHNDPQAKVLYTSAENLMNEFINSIKNKKNQEFRDKYRTMDVLLVDDIQFLSDKEGTQEEFFHTFNALHSDNKQIVISSDKHPHELKTLEERLRSRFGSGLTVDITLPDFETRTAILEKKVELDHIQISSQVTRYIAKSISSNIRELEGALNKVTAYAKLTKTDITMELAERALKDIVNENEKREINVEYIQEIVANYFGITPDEIRSKKRTANITYSRHIAMYLSRMIIDQPLIKIGKAFGGRDHSTVIHACDKISEELETKEDLKNDIFELEKKIKGE